MNTTRKQLLTSLGAMVLVFGLSACEPEGDAERAGERIDDAAEKAAEAVNPEGPAERAGEKWMRRLKRPERPPRTSVTRQKRRPSPERML